MNRSFVLGRLKRIWPVAVILGFFGSAVMVCSPLFNIPLYDDWAYGGNVESLLETGELTLVGTQASFVAQWLSAAAFCKVLGFSFSTLHVYTLLLGLAGTLAAYGICRAYDQTRLTSTLVCLALASAPFYLHFCYTFMTDVPAAATNLVAFWAYLAAEREQTGRPKPGPVSLYLLCAFFFVFSTMIRDFPIIVPVPLALSWFVMKRPRGRHLSVLLVLPAAAACYLWVRFFVTSPWRPLKLGPEILTLGSVRQVYIILAYLGLFLSPIILGFSPDLLRRHMARDRRQLVLFGGLLAAMIAVAVMQYHWGPIAEPGTNDELMPYRPGFISIYGPYNEIPLPGMRTAWMGLPLRLVLTAVGVYGAAFIAYCLIHLFVAAVTTGAHSRRLRNLTVLLSLCPAAMAVLCLVGHVSEKQAEIGGSARGLFEFLLLSTGLLVLTYAAMCLKLGAHSGSDRQVRFPDLTAGAFFLCLWVLTFFILSGKFFIRHALAMVPGVLIILLAVVSHLRLNRPVALVGIVCWSIWSLVWTKDQISFNEARWTAGNWLLAQGVPPDEIHGGFEFDCSHLEFRGARPSNAHVRIGQVWVKPIYVLTMDNFARTYPRARRDPSRVTYHLNHAYCRITPPDSRCFPYYSRLFRQWREVQIWGTDEVRSSVWLG